MVTATAASERFEIIAGNSVVLADSLEARIACNAIVAQLGRALPRKPRGCVAYSPWLRQWVVQFIVNVELQTILNPHLQSADRGDLSVNGWLCSSGDLALRTTEGDRR